MPRLMVEQKVETGCCDPTARLCGVSTLVQPGDDHGHATCEGPWRTERGHEHGHRRDGASADDAAYVGGDGGGRRRRCRWLGAA